MFVIKKCSRSITVTLSDFSVKRFTSTVIIIDLTILIRENNRLMLIIRSLHLLIFVVFRVI